MNSLPLAAEEFGDPPQSQTEDLLGVDQLL